MKKLTENKLNEIIKKYSKDKKFSNLLKINVILNKQINEMIKEIKNNELILCKKYSEIEPYITKKGDIIWNSKELDDTERLDDTEKEKDTNE